MEWSNHDHKSGCLKTLQWLGSKAYPWSTQSFAYAAQSGNLDIMKWLFASGCPWDAPKFSNAVSYGNTK